MCNFIVIFIAIIYAINFLIMFFLDRHCICASATKYTCESFSDRLIVGQLYTLCFCAKMIDHILLRCRGTSCARAALRLLQIFYVAHEMRQVIFLIPHKVCQCMLLLYDIVVIYMPWFTFSYIVSISSKHKNGRFILIYWPAS